MTNLKVLFKNEDVKVWFNESDELKEKIYNEVLRFFEYEEIYHVDQYQCDDFITESPQLLLNLLDIFNFHYTDEDLDE